MTKKQWLAIARDALVRSGITSIIVMDVRAVEITDKQKEQAFNRLNYLEYQIENDKTD